MNAIERNDKKKTNGTYYLILLLIIEININWFKVINNNVI